MSKQRTIQPQVIAGCADLFQEAVKKKRLGNIYVQIAMKLRPATGTEHTLKENCGTHMRKKNKKLAPSSILREAKIAYYARNMFEAGRFLFFFVKAT